MPEINITKKGFRCIRCNHEWEPKEGYNPENKPLTCPRCKSPYWDTPRRKR